MGNVVGTPHFMPPEMALSDGEIDGRADIYALGCVGYWLITGELPFQANTIVKLLVMHAHEAPVPPSERVDREIPPRLEDIILRCLAKTPEGRPQSALALSEELAAVSIEKEWTPQRAIEWWEANVPVSGDR